MPFVLWLHIQKWEKPKNSTLRLFLVTGQPEASATTGNPREGQPLTPNLCGHKEKKREIQRGVPPLKKKREILKGLLLVCFTDGETR